MHTLMCEQSVLLKSLTITNYRNRIRGIGKSAHQHATLCPLRFHGAGQLSPNLSALAYYRIF